MTTGRVVPARETGLGCRILALTTLALACCSMTAAAERLFQWRDDAGQLHFSDVRPAGQPALESEVKYASPSRRKPGHLRPGELEILQSMAQRASRQSRKSRIERQENDRLVNEKRTACRNDRDQLHTTRNREARKRYIQKLRKNCW